MLITTTSFIGLRSLLKKRAEQDFRNAEATTELRVATALLKLICDAVTLGSSHIKALQWQD